MDNFPSMERKNRENYKYRASLICFFLHYMLSWRLTLFSIYMWSKQDRNVYIFQYICGLVMQVFLHSLCMSKAIYLRRQTMGRQMYFVTGTCVKPSCELLIILSQKIDRTLVIRDSGKFFILQKYKR